jgi:hypothetical protein
MKAGGASEEPQDGFAINRAAARTSAAGTCCQQIQALPFMDSHFVLCRQMASKNKVLKSYIGMGYYNTHVPPGKP